MSLEPGEIFDTIEVQISPPSSSGVGEWESDPLDDNYDPERA